MSDVLLHGTGWIPESHDAADLYERHEEIEPHLAQMGVLEHLEGRTKLPDETDLRQWAPPVMFQGGFNTCSAHVVSELLQFFEQKAYGTSIQPSRLFLYKVAKNYLQAQGDNGTFIRQVMGVLRSIGAPPEKYWPYLDPGTFDKPNTSDPRIDEEPNAFCYAVAGDYKAIKYYRLDRLDKPNNERLLIRVKSHLSRQLLFAFGFPLYPSLMKSMKSGKILFPSKDEKKVGSHAVMAIGYSDTLEIGGDEEGHPKTTGAFLIQNSWSTQWGDKGFGWLPYEFITEGLTSDFWTLTKAEWVDLSKSQLDV
jgi:C1A family cysteine protease